MTNEMRPDHEHGVTAIVDAGKIRHLHGSASAETSRLNLLFARIDLDIRPLLPRVQHV